MALWSVRRAMFKVSFLGLFVGFVIFVVGFSTPFWFRTPGINGSQGLWQYCQDMCHRLRVEEAWFEVVRVLMCVGLILYFSACVLALYDNCLAKYDPQTFTITRRVEIATGAAGLIGVLGLAVYTVMMKMQHSTLRVTEFSGSYAATSASCTIAIIVCAIMWTTNNVLQQDGTVLSGGCGQPMVMTYQSTMPAAYQYQQPPPNGTTAYPLPGTTPQPYQYPGQPQPCVPPSYPGQPQPCVPPSYPGQPQPCVPPSYPGQLQPCVPPSYPGQPLPGQYPYGGKPHG